MSTSRFTLLELEKRLADFAGLPSGRPTADRREEPRYPTDAAARLTVLGSDAGRRTNVSIADVSRSGLRLRMPQFVGVGSKVSVVLETLAVSGEIRWCCRNVDGDFDAGLKIERLELLQ